MPLKYSKSSKLSNLRNTHLSKYEQVDLHGLFVNEAVPITKSIL